MPPKRKQAEGEGGGAEAKTADDTRELLAKRIRTIADEIDKERDGWAKEKADMQRKIDTLTAASTKIESLEKENTKLRRKNFTLLVKTDELEDEKVEMEAEKRKTQEELNNIKDENKESIFYRSYWFRQWGQASNAKEDASRKLEKEEEKNAQCRAKIAELETSLIRYRKIEKIMQET